MQNLVDTYQYVADFPAAFAPLKSEFNMTAISALYNATDFIGISSYPSLTPNFTTEQLEEATEQFDFEVGQFGVNLTELNTVKVRNQGICVHRPTSITHPAHVWNLARSVSCWNTSLATCAGQASVLERVWLGGRVQPEWCGQGHVCSGGRRGSLLWRVWLLQPSQ